MYFFSTLHFYQFISLSFKEQQKWSFYIPQQQLQQFRLCKPGLSPDHTSKSAANQYRFNQERSQQSCWTITEVLQDMDIIHPH